MDAGASEWRNHGGQSALRFGTFKDGMAGPQNRFQKEGSRPFCAGGRTVEPGAWGSV